MENQVPGAFPRLRHFLVVSLASLLFASSCTCPTGGFEDNFGRFYSLVTVLQPDFGVPVGTSGTLDTLDWGCGIWNITPLEPLNPENPIAWQAENPNPNPADQCCYAFRFDGHTAPGGCAVILGTYESVGGKCEQSGQMFLQTAQ